MLKAVQSHVQPEPQPTLSVVVPAYNEQGNLREFHRVLGAALLPLGLEWEVVYVDDGSGDATWAEIEELHAGDPRVHGIRLSRNFGHQHALFAGLSQARGRAVVSIDADLQHPPVVIRELVSRWQAGSKVVHTVRIDGEDTELFKRITSRLFYRTLAGLSGIDIEKGMADFRLIDRQVLDRLLQFGEEGLFLRGLVQWVGYPSTSVTYRAANRFSGSTKYSVRKMLSLAWSGITSFSIVPLRIAILIGLVTSVISFGGICYAAVSYFMLKAVPGWPSLVSIASFLFGVLFILLGVIGEYIGRILIEVRQRPRYLVDEVVGLSEAVPDRARALPSTGPWESRSFSVERQRMDDKA
jgi:glycosyltransferase involved in cell wall biosynthesis